MKIVYIGNDNQLAESIIERMSKEENEVYFITNSNNVKKRKHDIKYRYYYIDNADEIKDIFILINPDAVIFAGFGYTKYEWGKEERENFSLLAEVLEESVHLNAEMFVYFSSVEVYGSGNYIMTEESEQKSETSRGMWLSQGENIVNMYHKKFGLKTVILRLDYLFGNSIEAGNDDLMGHLVNLVLEEKTEKIKDDFIQPIHISDVADAVKRVMDLQMSAVYNVSSSKRIKKSQIAQAFAGMLNVEKSFETEDLECPDRFVENKKIKKEQEWIDFWDFQKMLEEGRINIKFPDKPSKENEKENKFNLKSFIRRAMENLILFMIFFTFFVLSHRHALFAEVDWLLIYVAVTALCYGVGQGTFSVLLASAAYLITQQENIFEMTNFYSYMANILVILEYIFFGIVVGYTVDMLREENKNKQEQIDILNKTYEKLKDINEKNILIKNEYEKRVLDSKDGLPKLYSIINRINVLDEDRIFM